MSNLKNMREKRGMTQDELAKRIGSVRSYICRLESGAQDINFIQANTLGRLCTALDCKPEDLLEADSFEFEEINGEKRLIVDGLYAPEGNYLLVKIKNRTYQLSMIDFSKVDDVSKYLIPRGNANIPRSAAEFDKKAYWIYKMAPRDGVEVKVLNPISPEDWKLLVEKLGLTDDDISDEFEVVKGKNYGEKCEKHYICRQIRLTAPKNSVTIERELKKHGIEAANVNIDRINIRVK